MSGLSIKDGAEVECGARRFIIMQLIKASRARENSQRNPRNDALSGTDFDGARMGCEQAFVLAEIRLNAW